MKKEYDFSNAVRGKFYQKDAQMNLPIYLDKDIAEFIHKVANQKKTDSQSVVNKMLRGNKEIMQAFQ